MSKTRRYDYRERSGYEDHYRKRAKKKAVRQSHESEFNFNPRDYVGTYDEDFDEETWYDEDEE